MEIEALIQLMRECKLSQIVAEIASLQSSHKSGHRGTGRKCATEYAQDTAQLEAVIKFYEGASKQ